MEPFCIYIILYSNCILMSITYNGGYPFKEPFYKNIYLCLSVYLNLVLIFGLFFWHMVEDLKMGGVLIYTFTIPHIDTKLMWQTTVFILFFNVGNIALANLIEVYSVTQKFKYHDQNKYMVKNSTVSVKVN